MENETQRRLAAIVMADVAGYSRLMGADESGTLDAMRTHRDELWDPTTERFGGRVVNRAGDSALIEFGSTVAAMECSVAIQTGMSERNAGLPEDERIVLRIGVNVGEVIADGEEIYGDGVNIAARLQTLAEPGGIALSDDAYRQVRDRLDLAWTDGGEHSVKNIRRPIHVWRWSLDSGKKPAESPGKPAGIDTPLALPDKPSLAVLPFENMSGDPEQEYFADGMAEDIITALSSFDMLFVIARNSSFTYKGRAVDIRQVARELGVRYVLEGSVRRAGDRVRITGQLIEAESGNHLWANRFDGALEDIFELQDRIAESIAGVLEPTLRTAEIERARRKHPENLDAYDYQLRALPSVFALRKEENERAIELLDKAISLDPGLAMAQALKAWCMTQAGAFGWMPFAPEHRVEALALARAAMAADDRNATVLSTAGFVLVAMGKEHRPGVAALRRALELNRNSAYVCMHAGFGLYFNGDCDEAIALLERALRLSPVDPLAYHILLGIAGAHMVARRPEAAYEYALKSIAEHDGWSGAWRMLACACGHLSRLDEAKAAVHRAELLMPDVTISFLRDWYPLRDPDTLEYYLEGFRKAGFRE